MSHFYRVGLPAEIDASAEKRVRIALASISTGRRT
jgi:hypothetical protein